MKIETGYLYHIKDEYFKIVNDKHLMLNHKNNRTRPSYFVLNDENIFWLIPFSSKIEKYKKIIHDSYKKYGRCDFILIKKIFNKDSAILIQNAFPIIEKYIDHVHKEGDEVLCLDKNLQNLIFKKFKLLMNLKNNGINLFVVDVDKIKKKMLMELQKNKIKC